MECQYQWLIDEIARGTRDRRPFVISYVDVEAMANRITELETLPKIGQLVGEDRMTGNDHDETLMELATHERGPYAAMVAITRLAEVLTPRALTALREFSRKDEDDDYETFCAAIQRLSEDAEKVGKG